MHFRALACSPSWILLSLLNSSLVAREAALRPTYRYRGRDSSYAIDATYHSRKMRLHYNPRKWHYVPDDPSLTWGPADDRARLWLSPTYS